MGILDNFTPTTNPDNRVAFQHIDHEDELIIGGSCTHIFEFPFSYTDYVKSCSIIYKQGLDVLLEVPVTLEMVKEHEHCCKKFSTITIKLTPVQTQIFKTTLLDTFCQARIINVDDELLFDKPHYIKVIAPLQEEHFVG